MTTAVITGGSQGIGAACVRLFAQKGYSCAFLYHSSHDKAESVASETGALAICADVSDSGAVNGAFQEIGRRFGPADVLVLSAGISSFGLLTDLSEAEWDRIFSVNVKGFFNCVKAVLPEMINRRQGSIVSMSSVWGITGASCEAAYSASKAAVIGLTKALAKEVGPSGVRVNCVAPGVVDTRMNRNLDETALSMLKNDTPLGKLGRPEDIAKAVYYLASEDAAFVTGQVLSPNGGFLI